MRYKMAEGTKLQIQQQNEPIRARSSPALVFLGLVCLPLIMALVTIKLYL
jgi:hypothetical protein